MGAFKSEKHMMECLNKMQEFCGCWHPSGETDIAYVQAAYSKVVACLREMWSKGYFPRDVAAEKWAYWKNTLNAMGLGSIDSSETRTEKYIQLLEKPDSVGERIPDASLYNPYVIDNILRMIICLLRDEEEYLQRRASREEIMEIMNATLYPVVDDLHRVKQFWDYHRKDCNI